MGTQILHLRESDRRDWSYSSNHVDGALRLITVDDLLSPKNATISVSEWRKVDLSRNGEVIPKYAAISHSWAPSKEVERLSSIANRPLRIDIGNDKCHQIGWHGLCQAAKAARKLKCDHLWLDLVCLHQTSDTDKKLQIKNMGCIYEKAEAVIIMPGGVAAVQGPEHPAPWITRAWTLQEATLCPNAYVLILHPGPISGYEYEWGSTGPSYSVTHVDDDIALSELPALLSCRGSGLTISKTKIGTQVTTKDSFVVHCFGDEDAVVTALEGVLSAHTRAMVRSAAWRSMWLRTSTKPQDMVFSVMHVLGVQIEVDYRRSREDLIVELARKTSSFPSWLDIGGSLPFDSSFGLLPALPPFDPNATPAFEIGGRSVLANNLINQSTFIPKFDIKIKTPADRPYDGDLICAQIFDIQYCSTRGCRQPYISSNGKRYEYISPDEVKGSHVVVMGEEQVYGLAHYAYYGFIGPAAFFIKKSERGVWERINYSTTIARSLIGTARSHVRIGGSPGAEITSCDCHYEDGWFSTSCVLRIRRACCELYQEVRQGCLGKNQL